MVDAFRTAIARTGCGVPSFSAQLQTHARLFQCRTYRNRRAWIGLRRILGPARRPAPHDESCTEQIDALFAFGQYFAEVPHDGHSTSPWVVDGRALDRFCFLVWNSRAG